MILLFHNFLHFAKLLNKKYGTHTESRILHLHKIFYSASNHIIQTMLSVPVCVKVILPSCPSTFSTEPAVFQSASYPPSQSQQPLSSHGLRANPYHN